MVTDNKGYINLIIETYSYLGNSLLMKINY